MGNHCSGQGDAQLQQMNLQQHVNMQAPGSPSHAQGQFLKSIEHHTMEVNQRSGVVDHGDDMYSQHSGNFGETSARTILESPSQRKLLLLGMLWYGFQSFMYIVLANILVYITLHNIPSSSPSYPGDENSANLPALGTPAPPRPELFDLGFLLTPDWSHRPWWLKFMFVDLNVMVAQTLPPLVLGFAGRTQNLLDYLGTIGIINICKGIVQMATVLPPANGGEECWAFNFSPEQMETMKDSSFSSWFFQSWGAAHGCNDMLWSGHTAQSTVGFLFLNNELRREGVHVCIRGLLLPYIITYWWSVLACRMHYTIDVLVATLIACYAYTHDKHLKFIWKWANMVCGNPPNQQPYSAVP